MNRLHGHWYLSILQNYFYILLPSSSIIIKNIITIKFIAYNNITINTTALRERKPLILT